MPGFHPKRKTLAPEIKVEPLKVKRKKVGKVVKASPAKTAY